MGKIKNKKRGIFFTFISIAIMAVFILVLVPQAGISLEKDTQAIRTRISTIDNYVNDLQDRYFETVLRATTYKTILSLIFYINETGSYIIDLDSAFSEVMLNGSIKFGGEHVPIDTITGKKIMDNNTLINWSNRIIEVAKDTLNVKTNISIHNVSVYQRTAWAIEASLILNFTVNSSIANWKKENATITITISIEGFYDPYYLINTNGLYANQINRSTVQINQWDINKVREHLRYGTYVYWNDYDAPTFLMRFTNDFSNIEQKKCCGIESLVNPNKLDPSVRDKKESYVDYMFWVGGTPCSQLFDITSLWDEFNYFKLDFNHVTKYGITSDDAVPTVCP